MNKRRDGRVNLERAAEELGVSLTYLATRAKRGTVPVHRRCGHIEMRVSEVRAVLDAELEATKASLRELVPLAAFAEETGEDYLALLHTLSIRRAVTFMAGVAYTDRLLATLLLKRSTENRTHES